VAAARRPRAHGLITNPPAAPRRIPGVNVRQLALRIRAPRLRIQRAIALDLLWSHPVRDLWIASADGEFAGMVEFVDGRFVATDRTGGLLDAFSGAAQARSAVAVQSPTGDREG